MKQQTKEFFSWLWNSDAGELEKLINDYDKKHKIKSRVTTNHTQTRNLPY